ncbi:MAG: hypothetical protein CL398_09200 [Acidiferrobacteraceae bacterium]|nr:hypothetical protein [Acidiferrobacteraceae bacterium]|tara:strand:+ start:251 stop:487 length:237 start_codon:yes stop_codon:yes gene_type:complete
MDLKIKLVGRLKEYWNDGSSVEVTEGATVLDVLKQLNIPDEEAGMVAINDESVPRKERGIVKVVPGDSMTILPMVHGG